MPQLGFCAERLAGDARGWYALTSAFKQLGGGRGVAGGWLGGGRGVAGGWLGDGRGVAGGWQGDGRGWQGRGRGVAGGGRGVAGGWQGGGRGHNAVLCIKLSLQGAICLTVYRTAGGTAGDTMGQCVLASAFKQLGVDRRTAEDKRGYCV